MSTYSLTHLSDRDVLDGLAALVAADRQTTASLLAHLAEVDERGLYLPAACSSLHVYCVRVLHLSEDAAFKRIRAARGPRGGSPRSSRPSPTGVCTWPPWCCWRPTSPTRMPTS